MTENSNTAVQANPTEETEQSSLEDLQPTGDVTGGVDLTPDVTLKRGIVG